MCFKTFISTDTYGVVIMENLEKLVSFLERLACIYREVIILILLVVLFSEPLINMFGG